ncbi:MAG TPA: hypothetical protein VNK96_09110 [Fimbriimonadales bacterium]|nr:hypothetical protein [Fimbriimonadales bacterium]
MRKIAMVLPLAALAALAYGQAENRFRNMDPAVAQGYYYPSPNEHGDDLLLGAGSSNTVYQISFAVWQSNWALNPTVDVRLYEDTNGDGLPSAGEMKVEALDVPVIDDETLITVKLATPVTVDPSKTLFATLDFDVNEGGAPDVGMLMYDPPSAGSSADLFVENDPSAGGWGQYYFGGAPIANFGVSLWTGAAPGPAVFDNSLNDTGFFFPHNTEYGDWISPEGSSTMRGTNIDSVTIGYFADLAVEQGDEKVIIRVYRHDGGSTTNGFPAPDTLLYESAPQDLAPGGPTEITLTGLGLSVPDSFYVTVTFTGMTNVAGDWAGLVIFSPPVVGWSENWFVIKDYPGYPGWNAFWFGGTPVANFYMRANQSSASEFTASTKVIIRGQDAAGDLSDTYVCDNIYDKTNRERTQSVTGVKILVAYKGLSPIKTGATNLHIHTQFKSSLGGAAYSLILMKKDTSGSTVVSSGSVGTIELNIDVDAPGDPNVYIKDSDGEVELRYDLTKTGFVPSLWTLDVDCLHFTVQ